jgi:hypothetical protein
MFRSDRDALAERVDDLRAENERLLAQNEAMRTDLLARHRVEAPPPFAASRSVYKRSAAELTPGERAALGAHKLVAFPTWAAVLLHFCTFGVFSAIHFNRQHGRLPQAEHDDPSAGKAIGFSFIPYFNLYWLPWSAARLADRLNLQLRLRGLPDEVPRNLILGCAIVGVIPYVCIVLGLPVTWLITVVYLQRAVNRLAALQAEEAAPRLAAQATGSLRVPAVKDLPGPDEVVEMAAEEEAAAAAADPRRLRRQ